MDWGVFHAAHFRPHLVAVHLEDHQAKLFSVFGPLSEDSESTSKVRLARQHGRDVTSSTVASELDTKLMTSELTTHGYAESKLPVL
jgi:hypothetical protein